MDLCENLEWLRVNFNLVGMDLFHFAESLPGVWDNEVTTNIGKFKFSTEQNRISLIGNAGDLKFITTWPAKDKVKKRKIMEAITRELEINSISKN